MKFYCSLVILDLLVTYQEVSHAKLELVCRTLISCSCVYPKGGRKTLDSLAWSKKYEILSISRLDLRSYGLTTEQINHLSDVDMQRIAEELYHRYDLNSFAEDVVFIARLVLAEKGKETIND